MSGDSTVASKQARLLAQKQRRLECHRQGVAVSLLLETGFARALSTSRAFVTWRMLAVSAPEAPSTTARPPTARTVLSASVLPGGADAADAGVLQQRLVEACVLLLVVPQERLDLAAQARVVGARAIEEAHALLRVEVERLSEQRAQAVANYLISQGVSSSRVRWMGFGETRLKVSTGDNVNEPLNRRVEIKLLNP